MPRFPVHAVTELDAFKADFELLKAQYTLGELKHDLAVVRYVNDVAAAKNMDCANLMRCAWADIAPMAEDLVRWPVLKELMDMSPVGNETTVSVIFINHFTLTLRRLYRAKVK
jgi:hypothetical protein